MPIAKLDSAFCTTATCPEGKDKIDYYDETLAGLILTVQQTGRKTLSLRYRDEHNRQRQYKLGNFPDISFDKAHPAVLWIVLDHHMLHVLNHSQFTRHGDHLAANWDRLLRVIDREAASGITLDQLCSVLFGANDNSDIHLTSIIYIHVLRPLCWLGLLEEQRQRRGFEQKRTFIKTPLWAAALPFEPANGVTAQSLQ